jgi:DNA-binding NarL/FixJ family response regulator
MRERGYEVEGHDRSLWERTDIPLCVLLAPLTHHRIITLLGELKARNATIVALLPDPSPFSYRSAVDAGAIGVVPKDALVDEIARAVGAALEGFLILPPDVMRELMHYSGALHPGIELNDHEIQWIRHIARGRTVTDLARRTGYSEREMYRCLQRLYRHLGTNSRTCAVVRATQLGLIE